MMLVIVLANLPWALVAARRIEEIPDMELSIKDGGFAESPGQASGEIVFDKLGLKYPGASDHVPRDNSFKAERV